MSFDFEDKNLVQKAYNFLVTEFENLENYNLRSISEQDRNLRHKNIVKYFQDRYTSIDNFITNFQTYTNITTTPETKKYLTIALGTEINLNLENSRKKPHQGLTRQKGRSGLRLGSISDDDQQNQVNSSGGEVFFGALENQEENYFDLQAGAAINELDNVLRTATANEDSSPNTNPQATNNTSSALQTKSETIYL